MAATVNGCLTLLTLCAVIETESKWFTKNTLHVILLQLSLGVQAAESHLLDCYFVRAYVNENRQYDTYMKVKSELLRIY